MYKLLSFIQKEFFHILRDRRTMLILIGMPIMMIVLFGFAISNEVKNVRVAYFTTDETPDVKRLVQKINANDYFTVEGRVASIEQADEALQRGKVDVVVYFGKDFSTITRPGEPARLELVIDACDPNTASAESALLSGIVSSYFAEQLHLKPQVDTRIRLLYNPQMESSYNFVPGIMGMILMVICAMMTSVSIVKEKEVGTMEVLLVSPSSPLGIIFAKMVPYFTLSCLNYITILLISVFLLKLPIAGNLFVLTGVAMLYILLALAFGLLISTLMETQVSAMLISALLLLLPTVLLSGMVYPIENLPPVLRYLSAIVPARWFISAVRKLMIEGLPVSDVLREIGVLALMFIVLGGLSLKKFKKRLE